MSCEESQSLLQKIVNENGAVHDASTIRGNNFESGGLKKKIGVALVLACLALIAVSSYVRSIDGLQTTELSFLPDKTTTAVSYINPHGKILDSEYSADSEIYCDEQGNGECVNRILGICTEHGPCIAVPSMEPTGTPTSSPSNIYIEDNCDPRNPPCSRWFLGICTRYYHCHEVKEPCGNSEDDDDAAHTRNEDCDPENPPCAPGETFLGICWKYQDCGDSVSSNGTFSSGDEGDETLSSNGNNSSKHSPTLTKPIEDEPRDNVTSPINEEPDGDPNTTSPEVGKQNNVNATSPVRDESNQNSPNRSKSGSSGEGKNSTFAGEKEPQADTSKDSNGTKPEDPGVGHVGVEDLDGDDFFDFKWMNLNITIPFLGELTSAPTMEPTQIHACDPLNPPCARYEVGICVEYQVCFGIHSTPHNTTQEQFNDDEGYTFEPTHMPVPDPTFRPSEFPTSTPTTTMPTLAGYTFEPTLTMMPTATETSHPTRFLYCDPQNPPCDNYFFGVCLGIRYCMGTHEPTPLPTVAVFHTKKSTAIGNA